MTAPFDPLAALQAAQAAVAARDHDTAVLHLSQLVPLFPNHPRVTGLVSQLVASAPDPLALVPHGTDDFGAAAIRAVALHRVGRGSESYDNLQNLAKALPQSGVIDWALPWLQAGMLSPAQREEAVLLFLLSSDFRFGTRSAQPPDVVEHLRKWLPHVRAVLGAKPPEDRFLGLYIIHLRQAGEMDEAIALSERRHRLIGEYETAVTLASSYRAARRFDEWLETSKEILRLRPDDIAVRLDLGDCLWEEQGKPDAAEPWYADALRLDPNNAWAKPSLFAVRYETTRDASWRDELEEMAENGGDRRVQACLSHITPFFRDFVYPADASINILNGMADKMEGATGTIRSATTDGPSRGNWSCWSVGSNWRRESSACKRPPRASRWRLW